MTYYVPSAFHRQHGQCVGSCKSKRSFTCKSIIYLYKSILEELIGAVGEGGREEVRAFNENRWIND